MSVLDLAMYVLASKHSITICIYYDYYLMQFTQECVYRFSTAQYSFGEKDREKLLFTTDVHWHCESSKGLYLCTVLVAI